MKLAAVERVAEANGWDLTWLTDEGVVFAELERDFIRSRTREALAVRRDQGVVLGRPRSTPDEVVARVVRERTEGKTAYAIARDLNLDALPSAPGRKLWSARC